jgi:Cft2 family RNA processing exonuclease
MLYNWFSSLELFDPCYVSHIVTRFNQEKNLVILPGYCVAGTVGNKLLSGQKRVCTAEHIIPCDSIHTALIGTD